MLLEDLAEAYVEFAFHTEGASRSGCGLDPQYDAVLAELLYALHLDRVEHPVFELGIFRQFESDPLDQLASQVDIGVNSRR